MAVPIHPEDPAPDQPRTPPPVGDLLQIHFVLSWKEYKLYTTRESYVAMQAARYGDLEDVQSSLAQGTTVSSQDTQGRTGAKKNYRHTQGLDFSYFKRAYIYWSSLHMGSANGHLDVVKCLVEHGANINMCNFEQNTPLHYAVLNAHKPVVEFLISVGASVSAVNRYDRTPVDEAISKGDLSLIECITRAAPIPEEPTHGESNGEADHDANMEDA